MCLGDFGHEGWEQDISGDGSIAETSAVHMWHGTVCLDQPKQVSSDFYQQECLEWCAYIVMQQIQFALWEWHYHFQATVCAENHDTFISPLTLFRRIFKSLVELEDNCQHNSWQEEMGRDQNEAKTNVLLKSIVLGDIPKLQKLLG